MYDDEIAIAIRKNIAEGWTPTYGLALESCEIQSISFDEDTLRRRRQFRDGLSAQEQMRIEQAYALGSNNKKIVSVDTK
jgi:membrane protease subunit (stomatin/prohibitin family)